MSRGRGRPPVHPQDRIKGMVAGLALSGTPDTTIARIVGIDYKTLKRHYVEELETSVARANVNVAQALYKTACDTKAGVKHVTAAIFWLEAKAGWRRKDDGSAALAALAGDTTGETKTLRIEFVGAPGGEELGTGPLQPGDEAAPAPDDETP